MSWDDVNGFKDFINYIEDFNTVSIIIRLVLSTILGGIIGIERESKRHAAGFRTFTLVCISSALATIVNLYLAHEYGQTDLSRIPAGVISGIGFLGAGTIIVTRKNHIKGLTTAAAFLATASLGISLGAGMLFISIVAFALIFVTITILSHISAYISSHNRVITIYIEADPQDMEAIKNIIKERGYLIKSFERKRDSYTLEIDTHQRLIHSDIISDLSSVPQIKYIEEA